MPHVDELSHTAQLKRVGFGRPPPRHGLHLLQWFSAECLYFDENDKMVPRCNPENGDFGFHLFENRCHEKLLPHINFPYYVVGNLNTDGADELPDYVCQAYTGLYDNSNKDRIIVSLKNGWFDKVYITEHRDEWDYNPKKTYCIDKKLIKYINHKNRLNFLNEMGIRSTVNPVRSTVIPIRSTVCVAQSHQSAKQETPRSRGFWDFCTIL